MHCYSSYNTHSDITRARKNIFENADVVAEKHVIKTVSSLASNLDATLSCVFVEHSKEETQELIGKPNLSSHSDAGVLWSEQKSTENKPPARRTLVYLRFISPVSK